MIGITSKAEKQSKNVIFSLICYEYELED